MVYKLDSIDRILNKIIMDLGLGSVEIPYTDYVEWIADGLEHIGSYYQMEEKSCTILIEDYVGMLPCDFYKPIRMKGGCEIARGEGGFYGGTLVNALNEAGVDYEALPAYERFKVVAVPGLAKVDNMLPSKAIANSLQYNNNLIGNPEVTSFTDRDYNTNFNSINTAFQFGVIDLQYLAMPIDEKGRPLVPDDVSFRDAMFWKVAYHISMRDPKCLANPRMQDMEYCRQQWNRTCVQARAAANMPDLEMLVRMKNNWLRLHNTLDDDQLDFRETGKRQSLNLDGRY